MARYRLDLAYDGTAYSGFAAQPGRSTIQGELERALGSVAGTPISVDVAGRTDAGVHALEQVVAFDLPDCPGSAPVGATRQTLGPQAVGRSPGSLQGLHARLAGLLPPDIRPRRIAWAEDGFDPRRDALAREYVYLLALEEAPLLRHMTWDKHRALDLDAMNEAAASLVGVHDFTSFCLADAPRPHVRDLMRLDVQPSTILDSDVAVVTAVANAFLHGMVRALVGTLVDIGRGRRNPSRTTEVLETLDRGSAGQAAPARGLTLARVYYDRDELGASLVREHPADVFRGPR